MGKVFTSATRKFLVPYTSKFGSITPPRRRGAMSAVPIGCFKDWRSCRTNAAISSSLVTDAGGSLKVWITLEKGAVDANVLRYLIDSTRTVLSAMR